MPSKVEVLYLKYLGNNIVLIIRYLYEIKKKIRKDMNLPVQQLFFIFFFSYVLL